MKTRDATTFLSALLMFFLAGAPRGTRAKATEWPQWRGPARGGVTQEESGWPEGWSPDALWRKEVGEGTTSPIVARGRLYVMGWYEPPAGGSNPLGEDSIDCYEVSTGKLLWRQRYPARYQGRFRIGDLNKYGGPLGTPALDLDTGGIYTLGVDWALQCRDTNKGEKLLWGFKLYQRYPIEQRPQVQGAGHRDYGFTGSPLTPASRPQCGAVPLDQPRLALMTLRGLLVMRMDAGNEGVTIGQVAWETYFGCNIASPVVRGNRLLITSAYNRNQTSRIMAGLDGLKTEWSVKRWSKVSTPVGAGDQLFMADNNLKCIGWEDGALRWRGPNLGHGTCLATGDGKLIAFGRGNLMLVESRQVDGKYHEAGWKS